VPLDDMSASASTSEELFKLTSVALAPAVVASELGEPLVQPRIARSPSFAVLGRGPRALVRRGRLAVIGSVLLLAVGAGLAGTPALGACLLGVGAIVCSASLAQGRYRPDLSRMLHGPIGPPLRPEVRPGELGPPEIHAAYVDILRAHEDIRVALARSDGIRDALREAYDRVSDLTQAAGRVARRGNALQTYLRKFCPDGLDSEASRLEARMAETCDPQAAAAFRQAARARRQHLELYRQIEGLYDRVKARLALVASFLGAVGALVIKLHALDTEQIDSAGSSISDHLDLLRGDLELLESSLEGALSS
jgi:hypothetical protein